MSDNIDAFKIGQFGFFKDPELKMRLSEDNLYDQIGADGTVDVWFGGKDIWIPDYGEFNIHVTCKQSFFWDIVDENGKRTKDGFESMQIPYNPNFEPMYGDLIPLNKDEVFDYTYENPASGNKQLICSNLWFYTNHFSDEYYRYNLLLMDQSEGNFWPNEIGVRSTPMNDKLTIHTNEFIMGYRPKVEYLNQLAVLRKVISGPENKILFRLKVDLEFLAENPNAVRRLRIFSQTDDTIEYTLYPVSVDSIMWLSNRRNFLNEYQRYLLDFGVTQYLPKESELDWADKEYQRYMKASNYVLKMDQSYLSDVTSDINRIMAGENLHTAGYTSLIRREFIDWLKENKETQIVETPIEILKRVMLSRKYFKGFTLLASNIGQPVDIPGIPEVEGLTPEPVGPIVEIYKDGDGIRRYTNGYIPSSAKEYLNPKSGYAYTGAIGSGFYKIVIAEQERNVFCDMMTDGGGWMIIIGGHATKMDYLSMFGDTFFIKSKLYRHEEKGIGWDSGGTEELSFQMYNIPFNEVLYEVSGDYSSDTASAGSMRIITASGGEVFSFIANPTQEIINTPGGMILTSVTQDIIKHKDTSLFGTGEMNSLTIKMSRFGGGYYAKRYISMLRIR